MWQEILAIDSKLSQQRMAQEKEFRPLYLKRRLQLLQGQSSARDKSDPYPRPPSDPHIRRKYISLRVKLLKGQFGVTNDLLSLRSLSLSTQDHARADPANNLAPSSVAESNRAAFTGVTHILDQHLEAVTRLKFAHNDANRLICSSMDGNLSICNLAEDDPRPRVLRGHKEGIVDFDISESNQFIVSASLDGSLVLWDSASGNPVRQLVPVGGPSYVLRVRFLPRNNNLLVCAVSSGNVQTMNISTGKYVIGGSSPLLGKAISFELNQQGTLLWVGNDRGYIESFRLDSNHGNVQKGCRVTVGDSQPVTSISARTCISQITRDPCLLVTLNSNSVHLLRVVDDFGTVAPFKAFSTEFPPVLLSAMFAPILSYRHGTPAVAGCEDGSLVFFDLERSQKPCVNKLHGHLKPVISLAFSHNEAFLATADTSGQIIIWKK